ncbi:murein hydrolase activator EnvC family protein [Alkalithermobacter paradoxus]|uniref:Murein hydrolase activator EnvC n=1 Tax=Alkalithermobacter paradoxus TaxID=29349 RepID=A0A1V4I5J0_9FIRM|nr:murein hydrolase activator EnvC precursor [[Clostridium] thermoalcaliphilum]
MKKIALILSLLLYISSLSVFGQSVSDYQKKLNNVNQSINNINKAINENKKEQKSVEEQIRALEVEINEREREIAKINSELKETERQIRSTQKEINEIEKNIEENNEMLGRRLKVMYKVSDVGYLDVLFSSKDITELLSNLDMIKKIVNHDKELLEELRKSKEVVEAKKLRLENDQKKIVNLKNSIEIEKNRLLVSRGEQNRLKKQLESEQSKLLAQEDELLRYAKSLEKEIQKMQSKGDYAGGVLLWPAPGYTRITSPFGNRIHPIFNVPRMHTGIDIAAPMGATIVAANSGTVLQADWLGGYGKTVLIDHGGGIVTLYAHNSTLLVSQGQKVERGQAIARAGSTGNSTGPHLHFEVRKNGAYVDPMSWLR